MTDENTLTVIREMDDEYIVRINKIDGKTGETKVCTGSISRTYFEACIRSGFLQKIVGE